MNINKEIFWVASKYRTNPLSRKPGGTSVVVKLHNNPTYYGYNKIKNEAAYMSAIYGAESVKNLATARRTFEEVYRPTTSFTKSLDKAPDWTCESDDLPF